MAEQHARSSRRKTESEQQEQSMATQTDDQTQNTTEQPPKQGNAQEPPPSTDASAEGTDDSSEGEGASPQPDRAEGTESKESASTRSKLDELMDDPEFAREYKRRQAAAEKVAKERWEAEQRQKAEREKMAKEERLEVEKREAEERAKEAQDKLRSVELERDLNATLVDDGIRLADAEAREFLRYRVENMLKDDPDIDPVDAVRQVIKKHDYLVRPAEPSREEQSAQPREPASTVPSGGVQRRTEAPATKKPEPDVDTLSMSPHEYREYRRRQHGIQ